MRGVATYQPYQQLCNRNISLNHATENNFIKSIFIGSPGYEVFSGFEAIEEAPRFFNQQIF